MNFNVDVLKNVSPFPFLLFDLGRRLLLDQALTS